MLLGIRRLGIELQVAQRIIFAVAQQQVQRHRLLHRLQQGIHRGDRQLGLGGQLLRRRLPAEPIRELHLRAFQLADSVIRIRRQPDHPALLLDRADDRLADPVSGIRAETEAAIRVKLVDGGHQPDDAFLDDILEGHAAAVIMTRHTDNQAQVRLDHPLPGALIPVPDALGQRTLLVHREQRPIRLVLPRRNGVVDLRLDRWL